MAFTTQERVDIRRFCGYGAFGGISTPAFGYRFFRAYGSMEFKLSNLAPEEEATTRATYLVSAVNLFMLEAAVYSVTANLDTDSAAIWTHNKREMADRIALFGRMRRDLCEFLGVEPGPALAKGSGFRVVV